MSWHSLPSSPRSLRSFIINAGGISSDITTVRFVALDLLVIGGFLVLASAIEAFLVKDKEKKARLPLGIGVACIVVAVVLAFQ